MRLLTALAATSLLSAPAAAIDIILIYDESIPSGIDCCSGGFNCCGQGGNEEASLSLHMQVAALIWEEALPGNHQVTIRYAYADVTSPDASGFEWDGNFRPTAGRVRIPASWMFFHDPHPLGDTEFDMFPKLYRDAHPAEQGEAFDGAPPEILEVGYNGRENVALFSDLLSVCLHEIGHVLGLSSSLQNAQSDPPCDGADPYYRPPSSWAGGTYGIKAFETANGSFDCGHLAGGGIQECNGNEWCESHQTLMWPGAYPDYREHPSIVDILAVAEAGNWPDVELPRKYSLDDGTWDVDSTWLGDDVPQFGDDVYIMNASPTAQIELFGFGEARNVRISDGSDLDIVFGTLDVADTVLVIDPGSTLGLEDGSVLEAGEVIIEDDAQLFLDDTSLVDVFSFDNDGTINGRGDIDCISTFSNAGTINANGAAGPELHISASSLDLDDPASNSVVINAVSGDLRFSGTLQDPFEGRINVGPSRTLTFSDGWTLEHAVSSARRLDMDGLGGPARVNGRSVIEGRIFVNWDCRFGDDVYFESTCNVWLPQGNDALRLEGLTRYRGGSFEGSGSIGHIGGAFFEADTTVGPIGILDLDGNENASMSVFPDVRTEIIAARIDAFDGFDGQLNLDGDLIMSLDFPWELEGLALVNLAGGDTSIIGGAPMALCGTISLRDSLLLQCDTTIEQGATIHTIDSGSVVFFDSHTLANGIRGGAITGNGVVNVQTVTLLAGFGTIDPEVRNFGEIAAEGGWLVLNGEMDFAGNLRVADVDSVLWISQPWTLPAGRTMEIRDGWLSGASPTNTGSFTGHGFLAVPVLTNDARIAPGVGGHDGSEGTGILAMTGDLQLNSTSVFECSVGGYEVGESDGLIVDGTASLGGELALSLEPGFVPQLGDEIAVMAWNGRIGFFDSVTGASIPGGLEWELVYNPATLVLRVVDGCSGDIDGSGAVDVTDMLALLAAWGPCPGCPEDTNGDGVVDVTDMLNLLGNWGVCD